ncbi:hypothetical protein KUTeg_001852 [Tegillarca granosa]|uniref:Uncharacterized protein n=1 Tax=Tegillarca granosa TaxID=220873 RepID=A0ABQ9FWY8_TEGGR|nr:hypothetical protein KUTeg_001852 [Tegillarca granosa]
MFITDRLIAKRYLAVSTVRKLFLIFGFVGSSPFILWVSFLGKESRDLIVALIVIYWTVQSTTNAGFRVNHLDIAPKYV